MAKIFYQPGRYWGRITHQRLGETKTGKPQLVLSFLVLGKVNAADPDGDLQPVQGEYERTVYQVLTENTMEFVMEDLEKLGFLGQSFAQFDENAPDCFDLRGHELAFFCNQENDLDGNPRERWRIASVNSGPTVKALDSKAVRQLDAMFGRQLKALKKPAAATRQTVEPKSATEAAPVENVLEEAKRLASQNEDIPF